MSVSGHLYITNLTLIGRHNSEMAVSSSHHEPGATTLHNMITMIIIVVLVSVSLFVFENGRYLSMLDSHQVLERQNLLCVNILNSEK